MATSANSTPMPSRRGIFGFAICAPLIAGLDLSDSEVVPDLTLMRLAEIISEMAAAADALGREYSRVEHAFFQCAAPTDAMAAEVRLAEAAHDDAECALADALHRFAGIGAGTIAELDLKASWAGRSVAVAQSIPANLTAIRASGIKRGNRIRSQTRLQAS